MLLQLTVENFRSVAEPVTLSFLAAPGEAHPPGQVVELPGIGGVLRTLVLYGPNASGKTALAEGYELLWELLRGIRPGEPLPAEPNLLDVAWRDRPTRIELELAFPREDAPPTRMSYGIAFTRARVVEEWLLRDERPVFEREDGQLRIGDGLALDDHRRQFYGFVAEGTRDEQPFLAELWERKATELAELFDWLFWSGVAPPQEDDAEDLLIRHPSLRDFASQLLQEAGTGVRSVRVFARTPEADALLAGGKISRTDYAKHAADLAVGYGHMGSDGLLVALPAQRLSSGTRHLLNLAKHLQWFEHPCAQIIDEVDRALHPHLSRFVLARWAGAAHPHSQAVFTTHDTHLLDAGLLGRDAIWFVEKDHAGHTRAYSLAEFSTEQLDALTGRIEEGYLQGRFGAVPFLGDPAKLGWRP
jgi:hypothetical protein